MFTESTSVLLSLLSFMFVSKRNKFFFLYSSTMYGMINRQTNRAITTTHYKPLYKDVTKPHYYLILAPTPVQSLESTNTKEKRTVSTSPSNSVVCRCCFHISYTCKCEIFILFHRATAVVRLNTDL